MNGYYFADYYIFETPVDSLYSINETILFDEKLPPMSANPSITIFRRSNQLFNISLKLNITLQMVNNSRFFAVFGEIEKINIIDKCILNITFQNVTFSSYLGIALDVSKNQQISLKKCIYQVQTLANVIITQLQLIHVNVTTTFLIKYTRILLNLNYTQMEVNTLFQDAYDGFYVENVTIIYQINSRTFNGFCQQFSTLASFIFKIIDSNLTYNVTAQYSNGITNISDSSLFINNVILNGTLIGFLSANGLVFRMLKHIYVQNITYAYHVQSNGRASAGFVNTIENGQLNITEIKFINSSVDDNCTSYDSYMFFSSKIGGTYNISSNLTENMTGAWRGLCPEKFNITSITNKNNITILTNTTMLGTTEQYYFDKTINMNNTNIQISSLNISSNSTHISLFSDINCYYNVSINGTLFQANTNLSLLCHNLTANAQVLNCSFVVNKTQSSNTLSIISKYQTRNLSITNLLITNRSMISQTTVNMFVYNQSGPLNITNVTVSNDTYLYGKGNLGGFVQVSNSSFYMQGCFFQFSLTSEDIKDSAVFIYEADIGHSAVLKNNTFIIRGIYNSTSCNLGNCSGINSSLQNFSQPHIKVSSLKDSGRDYGYQIFHNATNTSTEYKFRIYCSFDDTFNRNSTVVDLAFNFSTGSRVLGAFCTVPLFYNITLTGQLNCTNGTPDYAGGMLGVNIMTTRLYFIQSIFSYNCVGSVISTMGGLVSNVINSLEIHECLMKNKMNITLGQIGGIAGVINSSCSIYNTICEQYLIGTTQSAYVGGICGLNNKTLLISNVTISSSITLDNNYIWTSFTARFNPYVQYSSVNFTMASSCKSSTSGNVGLCPVGGGSCINCATHHGCGIHIINITDYLQIQRFTTPRYTLQSGGEYFSNYMYDNNDEWNYNNTLFNVTYFLNVGFAQSLFSTGFGFFSNIEVTGIINQSAGLTSGFAGLVYSANKSFLVYKCKIYIDLQGLGANYPYGGFVYHVLRNATITVTQSTTFSNISASGICGGFVGFADDNSKIVINLSNSSGTMHIKGDIGGFIGHLRTNSSATINDSMFIGLIEQSTVEEAKVGALISMAFANNSINIHNITINGKVTTYIEAYAGLLIGLINAGCIININNVTLQNITNFDRSRNSGLLFGSVQSNITTLTAITISIDQTSTYGNCPNGLNSPINVICANCTNSTPQQAINIDNTLGWSCADSSSFILNNEQFKWAKQTCFLLRHSASVSYNHTNITLNFANSAGLKPQHLFASLFETGYALFEGVNLRGTFTLNTAQISTVGIYAIYDANSSLAFIVCVNNLRISTSATQSNIGAFIGVVFNDSYIYSCAFSGEAASPAGCDPDRRFSGFAHWVYRKALLNVTGGVVNGTKTCSKPDYVFTYFAIKEGKTQILSNNISGWN